MSLRTNPKYRQTKKRVEFDAKALGCECSSCPFEKNPKAKPPPVKQNSKLVIVQDWPTKQEIQKGHWKKNSTKAFVDSCVRSSGTTDFSHSWALLCRPETAKDKGIPQAIKCCSPRLQQHFRSDAQIPKWGLAAGPAAFWALTTQEGSPQPWLGTPLEGRWEGLKVIPTHIPWLVRMKAGAHLAGQFLAHVDRACRLSDGRLKKFEWPTIITEYGPEMDLAIQEICDYALQGKKVGVDIETRSDMSISCLGLAIPDLAICLQFPLSNHKIPIDTILRSCTPVTQNGPNFDHRVLRKHSYTIPGRGNLEYDDTLLLAAILNPQLPKNLGALVSNEFHAEAHKAQFRTDEETGMMVGDWDSRNPEVEKARRLYCAKDSWTTLMLEEVQQEQLVNYQAPVFTTGPRDINRR